MKIKICSSTKNTHEYASKSKRHHHNYNEFNNSFYNGTKNPNQNDNLFSNVISFQNYYKKSKYRNTKIQNNTNYQFSTEHIVTTVMFTDIVNSTKLAFEMGDLEWMKLQQSHHALIKNNLEKYSGRELQIIGDSIFMIFQSTEQAIDCARQIQSDMKKANLQIRIGIHTGEVLILNKSTISGLTINIASRVTAIACANQIVVSQTVKDIVTGSRIAFENLGLYILKGLPDAWNLFSVVEVDN